jgi:hypothetical protein
MPRWRLTSLAANGFVAMAVAFALVSAGSPSPRYSVWAEVAGALAATLAIQRAIPHSQSRRVALFAVTALLAAVWTIQFGYWPAIGGEAGWAVVLTRQLRTAPGAYEQDAQAPWLFWDLGLLSFAWSVTALNHFNREAIDLLTGLALLAAVTRLTAMHLAQTEELKARGESRDSTLLPFTAVWVVISCAGAALVLFPGLRSLVLEGIAGALALYLLVAWWREWIIQIVVGVALFSVLYGLTRFLQSGTPAHPSPLRLGGYRHPRPVHPVHLGLPALNWGAIALGAALTLLALAVWRARHSGDQMLLAPGVQVVRKRLSRPRPPRTCTIPPTPVRRLVYRWLRWQAHTGHPISPGQTLSAYALSRVTDGYSQNAQGQSTLLALVALYERERYGLRGSPPETTKYLARQLRDEGILPH